MATDLNQKQSAGQQKLVGADANGNETNFVKSTANQDLAIVDLVDNGGTSGVLAIPNGVATAIRVGGSNLANRKRLLFVNVGSTTMYWGMSNAVNGAGNGCPIFRNQPVSDSWGPNTTIWIFCPTGTGSLFVAEGA